MTRFLLGAIAAAFVTLCATLPATAAPVDDKLFLQTAIGVNMEEIQLGQIAQQKSQNAAVKSYGMTLVTDHTMNNMMATALAMKVGATVPTTLSADQQKDVTTLSALSGTAFDQMFLAAMVMGHQTAIQLFTAQGASTNADVANFAKMSLPTLQMHLMMAQMLQKPA